MNDTLEIVQENPPDEAERAISDELMEIITGVSGQVYKAKSARKRLSCFLVKATGDTPRGRPPDILECYLLIRAIKFRIARSGYLPAKIRPNLEKTFDESRRRLRHFQDDEIYSKRATVFEGQAEIDQYDTHVKSREKYHAKFMKAETKKPGGMEKLHKGRMPENYLVDNNDEAINFSDATDDPHKREVDILYYEWYFDTLFHHGLLGRKRKNVDVFMLTVEGKTKSEVAKELNIKQPRVSKIIQDYGKIVAPGNEPDFIKEMCSRKKNEFEKMVDKDYQKHWH